MTCLKEELFRYFQFGIICKNLCFRFLLFGLIQKVTKKSRPGDATNRTTSSNLAAMPFLPATICKLFKSFDLHF
jgi:hypothetical protein